MKFNTVNELNDEQFRRLTGVKRQTFDKMVGILEDTIKNRKTPNGRKKEAEYRRYVAHDFRVYPRIQNLFFM